MTLVSIVSVAVVVIVAPTLAVSVSVSLPEVIPLGLPPWLWLWLAIPLTAALRFAAAAARRLLLHARVKAVHGCHAGVDDFCKNAADCQTRPARQGCGRTLLRRRAHEHAPRASLSTYRVAK